MMETTTLDADPLDRQILDDLRALQAEGEHNLIGHLLDLLVSVAPPLLESIHSAAAQKDYEALYRAAHSLKGNCAGVGAAVLAAQVKEVEMMGREKKLDGVLEKIARIETEYARAIAALEKERERG